MVIAAMKMKKLKKLKMLQKKIMKLENGVKKVQNLLTLQKIYL
jgi:hypothetical protein